MVFNARLKSKEIAHFETKAKAVRGVFKEFCEKSTIHGIRYFAERRHWSERYWWIMAFGLSLFLCASSIQNTWSKWRKNPVTMSFTEKDLPISTIPFPTVTICPETKTYNNKIDLTAVFDSLNSSRANLSQIEWIRLNTLSHLCQFNLPKKIKYGKQFINGSIFETIRNIAPVLNDVIVECTWNYETNHCSKYFKEILTDEGLCFTFNALNSAEIYTEEMAPEMMNVNSNPNVTNWSLEDGYKKDSDGRGYPIRVFNVKNSIALTVFLQLFSKDVEYRCRGLVAGFKIFLHVPGEIQPTSRHAFRVPLSEEAQIMIRPRMIVTSKNLQSFTAIQRQCYFSNEKKLRFFRIYTQNNCEIECLANFTQKECNCVKFSQPRTRNSHICGAASVKCYQVAERKLFGESLINGSSNDYVKSFREECACLPACTYIVYDADIDRAKLNWMESLFSNRFQFHKKFGTTPSNLEIYFRDHEVTITKRTEMYTTSNFLANCGGLLGLFLGVSALSIIEFIYYSTVRLYWSLRQWKNDHAVIPLQRKFINTVSIDIPN